MKMRIEQWVLFAVLVVFGGGLAARAFFAEADTTGPGRAGGKEPEAVEIALFDNLTEAKSNPVQAPDFVDHRVFASRLIVHEPTTGETKPLNPDSKGPDGITIQWKLDHEFSLEDPDTATSDPDNDGFNNLEEYLAGTDPNDPASHPPLLTKLEVASYDYVPFRMIFRGYNLDSANNQMTYQINLLDVKTRRTRIVREGEDVEGYTVGEFRRKEVERFDPTINRPVIKDVSELDLKHPLLNEFIILVINEEKESDESSVTLRLDVPIADVQPPRVKRGETFQIREKKYQLLRAGREQVVIRDIETGEEITVGGGAQAPLASGAAEENAPPVSPP